MDLERNVFAAVPAAVELAAVTVTVQHVFPDGPESSLLALLIFDAGDLGVQDFLDVEAGQLNCDPVDQHDFAEAWDQADGAV
jgi:hypothetical protein